MAELPLYNRAGEVIAHVKVDDADLEWAKQWRWSLSSNGYAKRNAGGPSRRIYMHRELLGLEAGDPRQSDHRNSNRLDNQGSNLRIATQAQNKQNVPGQRRSSRFRGVNWDRSAGRWRARAMLSGVFHHIGYFDDEDEAGRAAAAWRRRHMPFSREAAV